MKTYFKIKIKIYLSYYRNTRLKSMFYSWMGNVHFVQYLGSERCALRKNGKRRMETLRMSVLTLLLGLICKGQARKKRRENCVFSCAI
jgi:hypothetical protein